MRRNKKRYRVQVLQALGEAVRIKRRDLGLSQEELGDRAELHRTYVTDIESGLRNMSLLTLIKISRALTLPLSQLIIEAESHDGWHLDGPNKGRTDDDQR